MFDRVGSTPDARNEEAQNPDFQLSQKTIAGLELQIINTFKERNKQLAEFFPTQIEKLKLDEKLNVSKLLGKKIEVFLPICKSLLFDRLAKKLKLSTAELLQAYRKAVENKLKSLVGEGNYKLSMFVHFRELKETEEFFQTNPALKGKVCVPIEEWRLSPRWKAVAEQLRLLIEKHKEEWDALLSKDCLLQRNRAEAKGMNFDILAQKQYFFELCVDHLSFMVSNKIEPCSDDNIVYCLKNNSIAMTITNDAHPDNIYSFAKDHASEIQLPKLNLGANGFVYVTIDSIESKSLVARPAILEVRELHTSFRRGSIFDFDRGNESSSGSSLSTNSGSDTDEEEKIVEEKARNLEEERKLRLDEDAVNLLLQSIQSSSLRSNSIFPSQPHLKSQSLSPQNRSPEKRKPHSP